MMKRSMEDREVETLAMANCLMLLAHRVGNNSGISSSDRVFQCKTCNKSFNSFQALGGHRASHKKPRLMENAGDVSFSPEKIAVFKPKIHECSICGQTFPMGQALGGHMRRHRGAPQASIDLVTKDHKPTQKVIPVLKRCNSRRIMLDLNLTPYENELELENKIAPALGCF
ncbi:hypothetical protein Leryth_000325 [Lithospermum erythrorhizon]|nr:hypothetical protein Leryth_000325 [Lithospermum erythrorhizon]